MMLIVRKGAQLMPHVAWTRAIYSDLCRNIDPRSLGGGESKKRIKKVASYGHYLGRHSSLKFSIDLCRDEKRTNAGEAAKRP